MKISASNLGLQGQGFRARGGLKKVECRVLGEFRAWVLVQGGVEGLGLRAVELRLKGDDLRFRRK